MSKWVVDIHGDIEGDYEIIKEYEEPQTGHCKDCKYFEYDSVAKVDGIPLIVAHEICKKWGDGCKTKEDGFCFMFEPRMESMTFKVIDIKTGKEPTDKVINNIAQKGGLMTMDIDQFFVGEDGTIILADDCGNITYCDMERFKAVAESEDKE